MLPFCFVLSCSQLLLFPKKIWTWIVQNGISKLSSTCCPMRLPSCFQKVSVHGSCKNSFQIEHHSIFSIAGRAAPFLFLKIQIYRFCSTKFHTWHPLIFYHDAWCAAPFLFLKTSVYSVLLKIVSYMTSPHILSWCMVCCPLPVSQTNPYGFQVN